MEEANLYSKTRSLLEALIAISTLLSVTACIEKNIGETALNTTEESFPVVPPETAEQPLATQADIQVPLGSDGVVSLGGCQAADLFFYNDINAIAPLASTETFIITVQNSTIQLYTHSNCSPSSAVSLITVQSGVSFHRFYFEASTPSPAAWMEVSNENLGASYTDPFPIAEVIDYSVTALWTNGKPALLPTNSCVGPIKLQHLKNGDPSPSPSSQSATLEVSPNSGVDVFLDSSCTMNAGNPTQGSILAGETVSTEEFYVWTTNTDTHSLLVNGESVDSFEVGSSEITQIALTSPSVPTNVCTKITASFLDAAGNPAISPIATTLTATPSQFLHTDGNCTNHTIDPIPVLPGQGSVDLYFKHNLHISNPVTVKVTAFEIQAETQIQMEPPGIPKIVVTSAPDVYKHEGVCQPIKYQLKDPETYAFVPVTSQTSINLSSSSPGVKFYGDSSCTGEITEDVIPEGHYWGKFFTKHSGPMQSSPTGTITLTHPEFFPGEHAYEHQYFGFPVEFTWEPHQSDGSFFSGRLYDSNDQQILPKEPGNVVVMQIQGNLSMDQYINHLHEVFFFLLFGFASKGLASAPPASSYDLSSAPIFNLRDELKQQVASPYPSYHPPTQLIFQTQNNDTSGPSFQLSGTKYGSKKFTGFATMKHKD